jgi:hypothetical protein
MYNIPHDDLVNLANIILDKPAIVETNTNLEFKRIYLPEPINIGNVEEFCNLHDFVFQKNQNPFPKDQQEISSNDYYMIGNLKIDEQGRNIAEAVGGLVIDTKTGLATCIHGYGDKIENATASANMLLNKAIISYQSQILNQPEFVAALLKKDISDEDKMKALYAKILTSEIDKKFDPTKENVVHVGESHVHKSLFFSEHIIKAYLEDTYNVKKICTENFISSSKKDNKNNINQTLNGIKIGMELYKEYHNDNDFSKRENIKFINLQIDNPSSESAYKQREQYMYDNILSYSKGSNVLVITGADHMVIDEKLKAAGKNVIMFAPEVDTSQETRQFILDRNSYYEKNSFILQTGFPSGLMIKMDSLSYGENKAEAEKALKILYEVEAEVAKSQPLKQKTNNIQK